MQRKPKPPALCLEDSPQPKKQFLNEQPDVVKAFLPDSAEHKQPSEIIDQVYLESGGYGSEGEDHQISNEDMEESSEFFVYPTNDHTLHSYSGNPLDKQPSLEADDQEESEATNESCSEESEHNSNRDKGSLPQFGNSKESKQSSYENPKRLEKLSNHLSDLSDLEDDAEDLESDLSDQIDKECTFVFKSSLPKPPNTVTNFAQNKGVQFAFDQLDREATRSREQLKHSQLIQFEEFKHEENTSELDFGNRDQAEFVPFGSSALSALQSSGTSKQRYSPTLLQRANQLNNLRGGDPKGRSFKSRESFNYTASDAPGDSERNHSNTQVTRQGSDSSYGPYGEISASKGHARKNSEDIEQNKSSSSRLSDRIYEKAPPQLANTSYPARSAYRPEDLTLEHLASSENSSARIRRDDHLERQLSRIEMLMAVQAQRLREPDTDFSSEQNDVQEMPEEFRRQNRANEVVEEDTYLCYDQMIENRLVDEAGSEQNVIRDSLQTRSKSVTTGTLEASPNKSSNEKPEKSLQDRSMTNNSSNTQQQKLFVITEESHQSTSIVGHQKNNEELDSHNLTGSLGYSNNSSARPYMLQTREYNRKDGDLQFNSAQAFQKSNTLKEAHLMQNTQASAGNSSVITQPFSLLENDPQGSESDIRNFKPPRQNHRNLSVEKRSDQEVRKFVYNPKNTGPGQACTVPKEGRRNSLDSSPININFQNDEGVSHEMLRVTGQNREEKSHKRDKSHSSSYLKGQCAKGEIKPFEMISDDDLLGSNFDRMSRILPSNDHLDEEPKKSDRSSKLHAELAWTKHQLALKEQTISKLQLRGGVRVRNVSSLACPDTRDVKCQTHGPRSKRYYDSIPARVDSNSARGSRRSEQRSPQASICETEPDSSRLLSPLHLHHRRTSSKEIPPKTEDMRSMRVQLHSLRKQLKDQEADNMELTDKIAYLEKVVQQKDASFSQIEKANNDYHNDVLSLQNLIEDASRRLDSLLVENTELKQFIKDNNITKQSMTRESQHIQTDFCQWETYVTDQFKEQVAIEIEQRMQHQFMEQLESVPPESIDEQGTGLDQERLQELLAEAQKYERQYELIESEVNEYKKSLSALTHEQAKQLIKLQKQEVVQDHPVFKHLYSQKQQNPLFVQSSYPSQPQQQDQTTQQQTAESIPTKVAPQINSQALQLAQSQTTHFQNKYNHYKRKAKKLSKKLAKILQSDEFKTSQVQELQQKLLELAEKLRDTKQHMNVKIHEKNLKINELKSQIGAIQITAPLSNYQPSNCSHLNQTAQSYSYREYQPQPVLSNLSQQPSVAMQSFTLPKSNQVAYQSQEPVKRTKKDRSKEKRTAQMTCTSSGLHNQKRDSRVSNADEKQRPHQEDSPNQIVSMIHDIVEQKLAEHSHNNRDSRRSISRDSSDFYVPRNDVEVLASNVAQPKILSSHASLPPKSGGSKMSLSQTPRSSQLPPKTFDSRELIDLGTLQLNTKDLVTEQTPLNRMNPNSPSTYKKYEPQYHFTLQANLFSENADANLVDSLGSQNVSVLSIQEKQVDLPIPARHYDLSHTQQLKLLSLNSASSKALLHSEASSVISPSKFDKKLQARLAKVTKQKHQLLMMQDSVQNKAWTKNQAARIARVNSDHLNRSGPQLKIATGHTYMLSPRTMPDTYTSVESGHTDQKIVPRLINPHRLAVQSDSSSLPSTRQPGNVQQIREEFFRLQRNSNF